MTTARVDKRYLQLYRLHEGMHQKWWKDKSRSNYQADLWMNETRNDIASKLLWDFGIADLHVLCVGGGEWPEAALIQRMCWAHATVLDVVHSDYVDMVGDGCQLPFKTHSFDLVLCREVIEHVPNDDALLSEINRVLQTSGHLFLTTPNGFNVPPFGSLHIRCYTPFALLLKLADWGFAARRKTGDVPNIYTALLHNDKVSDHQAVLSEFMQTQEMIGHGDELYYTGTHLYVLAQKVRPCESS